MIARLLIAVGAFSLIVASLPRAASEQIPVGPQSPADGRPVLVELFTSQGCPNCPRANKFLAELSAQKNIIALSFAVDYWDYLGWQDTFATPVSTNRQIEYGRALGKPRVYTPQMVINGTGSYMGYKEDVVKQAVDAKYAAQQKLTDAPILTATLNADGQLVLDIDGAITVDAALWVVAYTPGLQTVKVEGGKNKGKEIVQVNMVSGLDKLADWKQGKVHMVLPMPVQGGCAILLQEVGNGIILAAVKLET